MSSHPGEIDCGWAGEDCCVRGVLDDDDDLEAEEATSGESWRGPGRPNWRWLPGWRRGPIRARPGRLRTHGLVGKCKSPAGVLRA